MLEIEEREGRPLETVLRELYVGQKMSAVEIGRMYGCKSDTILDWLEDANIPKRTPREAVVLAHTKPHPSVQDLHDLYVEKEMTTNMIAKKYDVTSTAILIWLREANIPIRTNSQAQLVKSGARKATKEELENLYVRKKMSTLKIGKKYNVDAGAVCGWLEEYGIKRRSIAEAILANKGVIRPSDDELNKIWGEKHTTTKDLAAQYTVCEQTMANWLRAAGIIKKRPTEDELRDLYETQRKNTSDIAAMYAVNPTSVSLWLRKYKIKARDASESLLLVSGGVRPSEETLRKQYEEEGLTTVAMGKMYGVAPVTVANWLKKQGVEIRGKRYAKEEPKYSLEDATLAYTRYVTSASTNGETPVPIETFFAKYDPATLEPAKGVPPLRTYLRSYQNKNLEARSE